MTQLEAPTPNEIAIIAREGETFALIRVTKTDERWIAPEFSGFLARHLPGSIPLAFAAEIAARHGLVLYC